MELILDISPSEIPSAQRKGISKSGHVYTKGEIKQAQKRLIKLLTAVANGQKLEATAYRVSITYVYKKKTLKKSEYYQPRTCNPDLDNITKLLLDSITESHIAWLDDRSVSFMQISNRNASIYESAHVYIKIEEASYTALDWFIFKFLDGFYGFIISRCGWLKR
jgi:Holliday junction resolvase RusA-like endonuclease